jgi:hypothetical protein
MLKAANGLARARGFGWPEAGRHNGLVNFDRRINDGIGHEILNRAPGFTG